MSVHVLSWVMRHSETTGTDRLVLFCLADRANDDGICWPSIPTIARDARVHEDTARRAVRRLAETGHVEIVDGGAKGAGRGNTNRYRVLTENPAERGVSVGGENPADAPENPADASLKPRVPARRTVREPSEEPADVSSALSPKQIAREMTTGYYDWHKTASGVAPPETFMAIAKIVEAALVAGFDRPAISAALRQLDRDGRPLTRQTLWAAAAAPVRSARHDEVAAIQAANEAAFDSDRRYREGDHA